MIEQRNFRRFEWNKLPDNERDLRQAQKCLKELFRNMQIKKQHGILGELDELRADYTD